MKPSLSSRTANAFLRRACKVGAWTAAVGLALVAACSLGEGVTPQCDPNLAANQDGACTQNAACDDGKGGVKAEQSCCVDAAATLMGLCLQDGVGADWPQSCNVGGFLVGEACIFGHSDVTDVAKQITGFTFVVDPTNATTACDLGDAILAFCLDGGLAFKENLGGGGGGGGGGSGGSGGSAGAGGI